MLDRLKIIDNGGLSEDEAQAQAQAQAQIALGTLVVTRIKVGFTARGTFTSWGAYSPGVTLCREDNPLVDIVNWRADTRKFCAEAKAAWHLRHRISTKAAQLKVIHIVEMLGTDDGVFLSATRTYTVTDRWESAQSA